MTIPTKESFEEYLQILKKYDVFDLLNSVYKNNFDVEELQKIPVLNHQIDQYHDCESSHAVAKWLTKDQNFKKAEDSVGRLSCNNAFCDPSTSIWKSRDVG